jgi:hypothetical protein
MRIIEESQIQNDFNGFKDEKTIFEMQSGSKWQQAEYKYNYHYEFMPKVKIIEELGNYYLQVDSMNDKVLVKKL